MLFQYLALGGTEVQEDLKVYTAWMIELIMGEVNGEWDTSLSRP